MKFSPDPNSLLKKEGAGVEKACGKGFNIYAHIALAAFCRQGLSLDEY